MAFSVKPFTATYYNRRFANTYSKLVCPPYDIISKKELSALRKGSPYNFSNVLIADSNNYAKTAKVLHKWLDDKVLVDDRSENFYLYEQEFCVDNKTFRRFGILSLLKMDKGSIFPHEYTLRGPKEDRKRIIKAVKANLSPVFIIASGRVKTLEEVYQVYRRKKPFVRFKDKDGNVNSVWVVKDKKQIKDISRAFGKSKLVIADGHHRFEISYDYFKKNKKCFKDLNYILAYITDCQDGLLVLPTHRIVNIPDNDDVFFKKLKPYFEVKKVTKNRLKSMLKKADRFCLGVYRRKKTYLLELKNPSILKDLANDTLKELDTYVFHELVVPLFTLKDEIEYSHDFDQACKKAGPKKTVFFLRAASLDSIIKISSKGLRFPQKSTYFYPKVLSGIVIRRFNR